MVISEKLVAATQDTINNVKAIVKDLVLSRIMDNFSGMERRSSQM